MRGKKKLQGDLVAIHEAFKKLIKDSRPEIDIESVSTGEYWLATEAKEKGLVDEIMTSDDYISSKIDDCEIIEIKTELGKNRLEKLIEGGFALVKRITGSSIQNLEEFNDVSKKFR